MTYSYQTNMPIQIYCFWIWFSAWYRYCIILNPAVSVLHVVYPIRLVCNFWSRRDTLCASSFCSCVLRPSQKADSQASGPPPNGGRWTRGGGCTAARMVGWFLVGGCIFLGLARKFPLLIFDFSPTFYGAAEVFALPSPFCALFQSLSVWQHLA